MDSSGAGAGGPKVTEHQIMNQMQTELQVAAMQEFFQARDGNGRGGGWKGKQKQSPGAATEPHHLSLLLSTLLPHTQTVRDKCFEKCVTKPSSSLSSSEQQCLSRCSDRYGEATQAVLRAVLEQSGLQ